MNTVPTFRLHAAMLEALAAWIDDEISAGTPAKWVAQEAANAARNIAGTARLADDGGTPR